MKDSFKPINERVPGKTFPPLLWTVLERALAKKTEERFASAAEFAHALQAVLNGATELPSFHNGQAAHPMGGAANVATPLGQAALAPGAHPNAAMNPNVNVPVVPQSTPLPRARKAPTRLSAGLLVGVAVAFLLVGAVLAAIVMKLVIR